MTIFITWSVTYIIYIVTLSFSTCSMSRASGATSPPPPRFSRRSLPISYILKTYPLSLPPKNNTQAVR